MNPQDKFKRNYHYMNHRLNLMKDGVHKMQQKDSEFSKGKMSEVIQRIKEYTNDVDQRYPVKEGHLNLPNHRSQIRSKKGLHQEKSHSFKNPYNDYVPRHKREGPDITKTMKMERDFREGFGGQSISKARESYQKRMQRSKLSRIVRPYVKTPEPRRPRISETFRQSIDVANRKYYELKNSRTGGRPSLSNLIAQRSRSSNLWKGQGLMGISKEKGLSNCRGGENYSCETWQVSQQI